MVSDQIIQRFSYFASDNSDQDHHRVPLTPREVNKVVNMLSEKKREHLAQLVESVLNADSSVVSNNPYRRDHGKAWISTGECYLCIS